MGREKIINRTELPSVVQQWRAQSKRVVFANGCFDGLHGGHVSYLEDSADQGDILVVGVNSDSSVRGLKGEGRPIMKENDRMEMLASLECVDVVVSFHEPMCTGLLEEILPDVHSKGTDYTAENVPERDTAIKLGIEIYIAGPPKENASRKIVEKLKKA